MPDAVPTCAGGAGSVLGHDPAQIIACLKASFYLKQVRDIKAAGKAFAEVFSKQCKMGAADIRRVVEPSRQKREERDETRGSDTKTRLAARGPKFIAESR